MEQKKRRLQRNMRGLVILGLFLLSQPFSAVAFLAPLPSNVLTKTSACSSVDLQPPSSLRKAPSSLQKQEKGIVCHLFGRGSLIQIPAETINTGRSMLVESMPMVVPLRRKVTSVIAIRSNKLGLVVAGAISRIRQAVNIKVNTSFKIGIPSRPSVTRKNVPVLIALILACNIIQDTFRSKRRQQIDPTSEWGRYADRPSIRGRALFSLMGRVAFMLTYARIVNYLPGGDLFLFGKRRRNRTKGKGNIEVSNDKNKINHNIGTGTSWAAIKASTVRERAGEVFAEGLLRLGPLYIKIGQILSCRKDLLPEEWKESMERLQDRVPAKSGTEALELAYSAYTDPIRGINGKEEFDRLFESFDDVPLAAASLGQVHKATLRSNGKVVAIKLQRSRLRDIYDKDLALMNKIAKAVDKFGGKAGEVGGVKQSWEEIFSDAEEILYREIDYRAEAENAIRFAADFGIGVDGRATECKARSLDGKVLPSAASWLRTPFIYDDISTGRILVMEYVPSIKISDDVKLNNAGVTTEEKEMIAESLGRSYLRQLVCGKFFSTDPHAGNLGVIVKKDANGDKNGVQLVFYDFGQACALKDEQAAGILNVIEGIIDYDVDKCVSAFTQMGVMADDADLDKVRRKVKDNFETGKIMVKQRKLKKSGSTSSDTNNDESINSVDTLHPSELQKLSPTSEGSIEINGVNPESKSDIETEEINDAEIMSYFTLPAEYAFVARALSQMDGVGKNLDTDFDFISAAAPWIVEIKGGEKYLTDEFQKFIGKVLRYQNDVFRKAGFRAENMMKR
uniref:ABC1 atypical kinase-like domain-containing protein n=1 Tax=Chaetoceros debilis TaxID=122233 RepID=A0A7S3V4W0_9STRA